MSDTTILVKLIKANKQLKEDHNSLLEEIENRKDLIS